MNTGSLNIFEESDLCRILGVSRETAKKLIVFVQCLQKWQNVTQLIAPNDMNHIWERHVFDSCQLSGLIDSDTKHILDFGSGGGFPGLVLAIIGVEKGWSLTLVESNSRKTEFLKYVSRETNINIHVMNKRFEDVSTDALSCPGYITARAVASLSQLIEWSEKFLRQGSVGLFPKGKMFNDEIKKAQSVFDFQYQIHNSRTDDHAAIIRVTMNIQESYEKDNETK